MLKIVQDIIEFMLAGEQPIGVLPSIPAPERVQLRKSLIREEVGEALLGMENEDLVEIADGLADSIVVIVGTALEYGIDLTSVWNEVHRTNMAKFPGGKIVRRESDGKILKPEGWTPPDIAHVLEVQKSLSPLAPKPVSAFKVGDRVEAVVIITENGIPKDADPDALFPDPHYIHANIGDRGTVVFIEPDEVEAMTIRYDKTATATLTAIREVSLLGWSLWMELEESGMKCEDLDEMVHDMASRPASAVNNDGLSGQVEYLLENGVSPLFIAGDLLP